MWCTTQAGKVSDVVYYTIAPYAVECRRLLEQ
jgi:hypothetical protein